MCKERKEIKNDHFAFRIMKASMLFFIYLLIQNLPVCQAAVNKGKIGQQGGHVVYQVYKNS